jgi:hypothetical protein
MKTKYKTLIAIFSWLWISAAAYGQTQLKLWLPSSLDAHEKTAYQKAAEAFGQKNPSIKVSRRWTGIVNSVKSYGRKRPIAPVLVSPITHVLACSTTSLVCCTFQQLTGSAMRGGQNSPSYWLRSLVPVTSA